MSNIVESAPSTTLFLEPFSTIGSDVLKPIPSTSTFLTHGSHPLADYFRGEFLESLSSFKTLFRHSSNSNGRFKYERRICQALNFLCRKTPFNSPTRCRIFELLNLNRIPTDYRFYPKDEHAQHWIIKELRAAGKTAPLIEAFPNSKFLTVMRHPCATVDSILRWFERGRLSEIRNELRCFNDVLRSQVVGEKYLKLVDHVESSGSLPHQVALYWRVHYETIINSFIDNPNHMVVTLEELSINPTMKAKEVFKFFGIPWSTQVDEYIQYSTQTNQDEKNPVSTVRSAGSSYKDWCQQIKPELRNSVEKVVFGSSLMTYFKPYYSSDLVADDS